MDKQTSTNRVKYAWLSLILNSLLIFLGALMKIMHYPGARETITAGLLFLLAMWFLLVIDILAVAIRNKPLWLISIFVFGNIAALVYLLKRDSLLLNT